MSFRELALRGRYPPARELVVRELCQALWCAADAEQLWLGAGEAARHARSLAGRIDSDARAGMLALDAGCVADELLRMARIARVGIGRG